MPRGDGTGPMGMGPMTGRGMGYCAGYAVPGFAHAGFGMGRGRGFRRMNAMMGAPGWGRCDPYAAYPNAVPDVDEKQLLKNQADYLEKQLGNVRARLKRFEEDESVE